MLSGHALNQQLPYAASLKHPIVLTLMSNTSVRCGGTGHMCCGGNAHQSLGVCKSFVLQLLVSF